VQGRAAVFADGPRWIIEVAIFNGTTALQRLPHWPENVIITRRNDKSGFQVKPGKSTRYSNISGMVEPNEGIIQQFVIWDKPEPLRSGEYSVIVLYAPEVMADTVGCNFQVP
jgi:hypothetical protein